MRVRAIPNARTFGVSERGSVLVVRLQSKPQDNQANEELEEKLSELAGAKAHIVKGWKNREKEVAFEGINEEEAKKKIMEKNNK
jgi:uncharacterized protein YggU (UPF0235/DUF167 family)